MKIKCSEDFKDIIVTNIRIDRCLKMKPSYTEDGTQVIPTEIPRHEEHIQWDISDTSEAIVVTCTKEEQSLILLILSSGACIFNKDISECVKINKNCTDCLLSNIRWRIIPADVSHRNDFYGGIIDFAIPETDTNSESGSKLSSNLRSEPTPESKSKIQSKSQPKSKRRTSSATKAVHSHIKHTDTRRSPNHETKNKRNKILSQQK